MNGTIIIIAALLLLAALTVVFVIALNNVKKDKESAVALVRESYERTMTEMKSGHEKAVADLKEGHSKAVLDMKSSHEAAISELKKSHDEAMGKQMEMLKAQMIAESEKVLKAREEELDKRAKATFENIAGGLDKDIKDMKEAFEQNKKTHTETSQALKVNIEAAVKNLREQTMSIGDKADSLAEALRGKNKAQGNWGEVILDNLFTAEGLREGRDYDKEETLRDEAGNVILNEDTSKKMRPDFILHYPNGNDIVIDSKVVLTAMYDYYAAEDETAKAEAAARNLAAIKEQVKRLSKKDYSSYLQAGHKMLDFVIMFVPVYSALRLAYESDRNLWHDAYAQGVLITTEETLMPFLRMINIAWTSHEQVANQQQIIAAAETVLARVSDFCTAHAKMGKKLNEALEQYDACDKKIRERGQSIVVAANKLISYGVPQPKKKALPPIIGMEEQDSVDGYDS